MVSNLLLIETGLPDPHDAEYIRVEALEDCGEILTTHSGVVTLTPGETTVYLHSFKHLFKFYFDGTVYFQCSSSKVGFGLDLKFLLNLIQQVETWRCGGAHSRRQVKADLAINKYCMETFFFLKSSISIIEISF